MCNNLLAGGVGDVGGRNLSNTCTMSRIDPNNVINNSLRLNLYRFTSLFYMEVTYDNSRKVGTTPKGSSIA
jgi:hypothetical protein